MINHTIENWEAGEGDDFVAFYFPAFLVVSVKSPKDSFEELLRYHDSEANLLKDKTHTKHIIQIIINSDLEESEIEDARQEAQDFVLRYAKSQDVPSEICSKILVSLPGSTSAQNGTKVITHICPDIVHGGIDDAPSVSFWIDRKNNVANLCGHSGSSIPLNGPIAPSEVPYYQISGPTGHYTIFSDESIKAAVANLEEVLNDLKHGTNKTDIDEQIETILSDLIGDTIVYDLHLE